MNTYTFRIVSILSILLFINTSGFSAPIGGSVVVKTTSAVTDSVCSGTNSKTLQLQGYFGTIVRWEYSSTGGNPWTTIAHNTDEYTLSNLNSNIYVRAVLSDAGTTANSTATFIRVDHPTNSGTLTGDNAICSGTNSGTVSLNGNTGSVSAWMYSFNQGSTWTANAGINDSSLNYSNLTQTTWYRVIVKNGACSVDTSNTSKVIVKENTVAGSALIGGGANISVCQSSNSGTISLSGSTGNVITWEKAPTNTGPWTQFFNNTSSHAFSNLTTTTHYRAVVSNNPCDTLYSSVATVNVDASSDAGSISGDLVQCAGTNSGTLTLSNYNGTVTNWLESTNNSTWTVKANASASLTYFNLTDTIWYKAFVKNGTCSSDTSASVRVDVNPASVGGTLNSDTVCYQINNGTINLSGSTGDVLRWESASNSWGPWSSIANTNLTTSFSNLLSTTYYRAVVESAGCNQVYSSNSKIEVNPTSNAGTISGNTTACSSGNSFTLNAAGSNGTSVDWITSTNGGGNWAAASNASNSLSVNNQNAETWYKYIAKSGVCANDSSATHKILIDPASVGGSLAGSDTVCSGNNTGTISLSGNTGSVVRWEAAVNANGPWSSFTHTSSSLSYSNLTNSVYYRSIVKSGSCSETTSDSAYLKVEPELNGGSISGSGVGCEGQNSGTLVLNNYGGRIVKWQFSTNNGTSWTDTVTSSRILNYLNLLNTTIYRVVVQAGVCGSTFSDTATITINSEPVVNFLAPQTCKNKAVVFTNQTINGNNNQYTWAFGDGNSSNLQNPPYQYSNHGSFNVTLTALSTDNCSASLTKAITIDSVPTIVYTTANVCKGNAIDFTNTSTPSGGTNNWSFGDGNNSSSLSPNYTYSSEGSYNCSLTYTAPNGCSETLNKTVDIYPQPVSKFTHPSVSEQNSFMLSNSSFVTSGTIGYQWNFGDGNSSTVISPTHTYSDTGMFDIQLISYNQNCRDTLTKSVVSNPIATPNFTVANLCQGDSTQFTNNSVIKKGGMTHKWSFDDGTTSTDEAPKHKYLAPGNYKVELTVTSDSGFVSTIVQNVYINPLPIPNFSAVSACESDSTEFINLSTINGGTMNYIWDFGLGGPGSTNTNTKYQYTAGGNYSVKLTATSGKGCVDSISNSVPVYFKPNVKWIVDTVCEGHTTTFTDSTTVQNGSASTYNWDFGNTNGSGLKNPTYTYSKFGTYLVKLEVTSKKGCVDSLIKNVVVNALPVPDFTASNICERDSLTFNNTSYHPLSSPITYKWHYGNGDTSNLTSPKYAFANAGTYNSKLVVSTTSTGCSDSLQKAITVHPRATPSFLAAGKCLGQATQFLNSSTISNGNLSYNWNFGNMNTSNLTSPNHTYSSSGNYSVKLEVTTSQNCTDTLTKIVYVWPQPEAKFTTQNVCNGDSLIVNNSSTYTKGSTIPDTTITYTWDFGDGNTIVGKSPKHLYSNSGNYKIDLNSVTDSSCTSSTSKNIVIYALPQADFDATNACIYDSLNFANKSSSVYGTLNSAWFFGDLNNSNLENPKYRYLTPGVYSTKLEVTDIYGCSDSAVKSVEAYPKPTSSFSNEKACDGEMSSFSDSSAVSQGQIVKWSWVFGDGTGSSLQHPSHLFLNDGAYNVQLEAETDKGCVDDTNMIYIVYPLPISNFDISSTCLNESIPLKNKASIKVGTISYQYNYSDGSTYAVAEPVHMPLTTGPIGLTQIATSDFGCKDSINKSTEVWKLPIVTAKTDTTLSYGLGINLEADGANTYLWEPASNLNNTTVSNPKFDALASQTLVVYGTDLNGCKNTDTIHVDVIEDFQVFPSEILTPDGNGYNDTWVIENVENYTQVHVQIVNSWGNLVFEEKAYDNTWEGTNQNNDILPDGTYYYIVSFDRSARIYKGAVTIIRNK